jgi:hypothetical protein
MKMQVYLYARFLVRAIPCSLLFLGATNLYAEDDTPVILRVEEDWELTVASPDANSVAPQVTCALFPSGSDALYATFELNHQSQPDFVPGGMQLLVWNYEIAASVRKFPHQGILSSSSEKIRWTQTMTLKDGMLIFEIVAGDSTTWGSFGGQGYLRAAVATNLTNLNGYHPQNSVSNSGVGYAANRVQSLGLRAVRLISSEGEILSDETDRMVHSLD